MSHVEGADTHRRAIAVASVIEIVVTGLDDVERMGTAGVGAVLLCERIQLRIEQSQAAADVLTDQADDAVQLRSDEAGASPERLHAESGRARGVVHDVDGIGIRIYSYVGGITARLMWRRS